MIQVLNKIFIASVALVLVISCSFLSNKSNNVPSDTDNNLEKIAYFINEYDFQKDDDLYFSNREKYSVNDSLSRCLSKLNKIDKNNEELKFLLGNFLEKKYLSVRKTSKNPKTFPVYNVSIWSRHRESFLEALKIVNNDYVGDFVCIDSIILKIDKLKQSKNNKVHEKCMDLVRSNNTGDCVW